MSYDIIIYKYFAKNFGGHYAGIYTYFQTG